MILGGEMGLLFFIGEGGIVQYDAAASNVYVWLAVNPKEVSTFHRRVVWVDLVTGRHPFEACALAINRLELKC